MTYCFAPAPVRSLAIADSEQRFPVNRIFCVGRNYAEHAREMGKDPEREAPFFFMKPAQAVLDCASPALMHYPPQTNNLHHEVELVVAIATGGRDIAAADALSHVFGYAVGLDMTRRDLQNTAKNAGRPWEFGKAFAQSAPMGVLHTVHSVGHIDNARIQLQVNASVRQDSNIDQLIWSVAESIAQLSMFEALEPGDLIMTGTPAGVAAVVPGDVMLAAIDGLGAIEVQVA
ncbi:MAG: fumarylacetoacetate hydrolase family protein [Burkholderiaceae bacterium]|jgi:fumarylpyruvate hydrolase|nr:fumarylacetoacetate hydrolase family protein [Burkholderiaceae bacterium]